MKPIMWTDLMTQVMKENARSHREWYRDRSCKQRKPEELSIPATTLVSDRGVKLPSIN
jgi:hypothetical protein